MSLNLVKMDSPGQKVFMLGNEAIARGAIEACVSVVACYPGTPSSEISDTLAVLSEDFGFHMEYSANEKVALEVAAGAAIAGGKGLAIMKHVGLNVASDAFFSLAYTGISGALVVIVCDDPFMFSSQTEEDTRFLARCAYIPVLDPSNPNEAKEMIKEAFAISECFGTPVMLRPTTRISHTSGIVELGDLPEPKKEKFTWDSKRNWSQQYVAVPDISRVNRLKMIERVEKVRRLCEETRFNQLLEEESETGVLVSGVSFCYVLEALDILGLRVSVLKIGTPFPLPTSKISQFLKRIKKLIVVEEGESYLELHAKSIAQETNIKLKVYGKENGFFPLPFEYNVPTVIKGIGKVLGIKNPIDYDELEDRTATAKKLAPKRPPTFCAGCPHIAAFYALKRATGGKAAFTGDIGCYGLGYLPPFNGIDLLLCMGGSIGLASGLQYVIGEPVVAIIGDSTFFHSGLSPLASAVYNRANLTLLVLDNSATAMTGFQPHPGTGDRASGKQGERLFIENVVKGLGVKDVKVVDQFNIEETIRAFKSSFQYPGVSVIICRQPCVFIRRAESRKTGKKFDTYKIVREQCDGCFLCSKMLGCPAIIQDDEVAGILPEICAGCSICSQICPRKAIVLSE